MNQKRSFKGSCHCGNIQYELITKLTISDFSIRRCDCSYCTKSGARYISDPEGELSIKIVDQDKVAKYLFGTKTATFHHCSLCGSAPFASCEIEGKSYGIVNINTLDEAEHFGRHAKGMSYDEEGLEERLARRKKNWIGKVVYT